MSIFDIDKDMSTRAYNTLTKLGVETIEDLAALRETDVLRVKHAGRKTVRELRELLERHGLQFSESLAVTRARTARISAAAPHLYELVKMLYRGLPSAEQREICAIAIARIEAA